MPLPGLPAPVSPWPSVPVTRGEGVGREPERACPATYLPGHQTLAGDSQLLPTHASAVALAHTTPSKITWPHARVAPSFPGERGGQCPKEKGETRTPQRGSPGGDRRAPKERAQERSCRGTGGRGENSRQGGKVASGVRGGPRHSSGRLGRNR